MIKDNIFYLWTDTGAIKEQWNNSKSCTEKNWSPGVQLTTELVHLLCLSWGYGLSSVDRIIVYQFVLSGS